MEKRVIERWTLDHVPEDFVAAVFAVTSDAEGVASASFSSAVFRPHALLPLSTHKNS